MSIDLNLSLCQVRARALTRQVAVAATLLVVVACALLLYSGTRSAPDTPPTTAPSAPWSEAASTLRLVASADLGSGSGVDALLSQLERHLPAGVRVRRLRYEIDEGRADLDLEGRDQNALASAVVTLESAFAQVRVLERGTTGEGSVSVRLALTERGSP